MMGIRQLSQGEVRRDLNKGHEGERRKPFRIQPFAYLRVLHGSL